MSRRSSASNCRTISSTRSREHEQISATGNASEHVHVALVEQPQQQARRRHFRVDQLDVVEGADPGQRLDPGIVRLGVRGGQGLRRVAGIEVPVADAVLRFRQELHQHAAGAPAVPRPLALAALEHLRHGKAHGGGDLLGLGEIGVRDLLQARSLEGNHALVAAHVSARVDGQRQLAWPTRSLNATVPAADSAAMASVSKRA